MGWSNTGKSTFIEACVTILKRRGLSVAAIKSIKHEGSFNIPGKDTTRFYEAGAQAALVSDAETLRMNPTPSGWGRAYAESLFPLAECILIEGLMVEGGLRVLAGGAAREVSGLKHAMSGFDVLISEHSRLAAEALAAGLSVYTPDDAEQFVEDHLIGDTMEKRDVTLTTGGVEVPINPFIKETIENVVLGLVKTLKKTNMDEEIVIRIGKR